MRSIYDEQLKTLHDSLGTMSALCEDAIAKVAKALQINDLPLAAEVHTVTEHIDRLERDVQSQCLKLLLLQQPVAGDLRRVSAALKMVTDLERIGNQSADIAETVQTGKLPDNAPKRVLHDMALSVITMVNGSVESFLHSDMKQAHEIIDYDDVVDRHFDGMKTLLIAAIRDDADAGSYAIDLLMIAKYLERIGDHAVNIAKWVIFAETGEFQM